MDFTLRGWIFTLLKAGRNENVRGKNTHVCKIKSLVPIATVHMFDNKLLQQRQEITSLLPQNYRTGGGGGFSHLPRSQPHVSLGGHREVWHVYLGMVLARAKTSQGLLLAWACQKCGCYQNPMKISGKIWPSLTLSFLCQQVRHGFILGQGL